MQTGSKDFSNAREGMASPLAKRLFAIDGVTNVFFGSDFVTVTKNDDMAWSMLNPEVFAAIMEHYTSGALLSSPFWQFRAPGLLHGALSCYLRQHILWPRTTSLTHLRWWVCH